MAWERAIGACLAEAVADHGPSKLLVSAPDERLRARTTVDWVGFPTRLAGRLGRARALAELDGPAGRGLQEEYVEWRVVREGRRVTRVELTTELAVYWEILAAHRPRRALALAGSFAGDDEPAPASALFGRLDPFARTTTPDDRRRAFRAVMLGAQPRSAYNNGRRAICFMVEESNTLGALLALALVATRRRTTAANGRERCLTADEAIPLLDGCAEAGRFSDPVLVERLGRLAFEERLVCFADPLGVYIVDVESERLRTPDGDPVSRDWFAFGRGRAPLHQRLTLEVPPGTGFCVGDLVDTATEQRIGHGGQIAELAQLAVVLGASEAGLGAFA